MKPRQVSVAVGTLLLLLWGLLVIGGRSLSLSMDEPLHIASGYIFLTRWPDGVWHLPTQIHPPFINILQAIGLLIDQLHIPLETLAGWGDNYVRFIADFLPYLVPLERAEVVARAPTMLLAMLLAALIFRWGTELAGRKVGLLAIALLVFDPLFLAHSRFATTDLGIAATGMATLYAIWRWLKRPSWGWTLITGGLMGIALMTKYSASIYAMTFALVALVSIFCRWKSEGPLRLLQALIVGSMSFLLVWASFGFRIGQSPIAPFPVPAPAYWTSLYCMWIGAGRRIFAAFGEIWVGPHWWYFPLNFVIKNPIPLLIGLLFSSVALIRHRPTIRMAHLPLAVFPGLYILLSVFKGMNVSYRHMLPVHPLIHLFVAWGIESWLQTARCPLYLAWGLLGLWYVFGTVRLFPDELTYFNELLGGPENAHRYFTDYTQDWGQSYKELRAYLETHPGPKPQIVYYTHIHPGFYGIHFHSIFPSPGATDKITPLRPQPGRYIIGIAPLYGLAGQDPMELEWFRQAPPAAMVGHSLLVYDIIGRPEWIAQCTVPVAPLDDDAITWGLGPIPLRRADFDCTTAWLYPGGSTQIGIYALHHALLPRRERCLAPGLPQCAPLPDDPFIYRHLSHARLSYEQRYSGLLPAFAAYEFSPALAPDLPSLYPVYVSSVETQFTLDAITPLTTPLQVDGPLAFLGVRSYAADDHLDVETWWQVTEGPITRPLSVMGHLLNGSGELIGQSDGLGVSPVVWQPGDIIVQRHRFPRPPAGTELWLRTGVYWLDTMEQWPIAHIPDADAFLVTLSPEPSATLILMYRAEDRWE